MTEAKMYAIFIAGMQVPLQTPSDEDLIKQYRDQMTAMAKAGKWGPILFKDGEEVVAAFAPAAILGIVQGATLPREEKSR